ncbi:MAG TPA: hypothetical protein VFG86_27100, partial [Chloroflexota bacterium]|nr:hypothetical protein [Chloroflexota bacterium]
GLNMVWGWIAFLVGIAYGWWKPGKQNKWDMLKTGVLVGAVIAILFALLGYATGYDPIGLGTATLLGTFISFVVLTVVFVVGVWIGDLIEGWRTPRRVT